MQGCWGKLPLFCGICSDRRTLRFFSVLHEGLADASIVARQNAWGLIPAIDLDWNVAGTRRGDTAPVGREEASAKARHDLCCATESDEVERKPWGSANSDPSCCRHNATGMPLQSTADRGPLSMGQSGGEEGRGIYMFRMKAKKDGLSL